ncbi:hypothetical protein G7085_10670 [Tessaracoccus sp. HDW20]|uniref:hypothetical protein n=1 Tax=Tessaracoccus coleopterorum TaxID=2714950 RepID=UPI0018D33203|nr:hypothetical protein [Tessaracoccus coleopterorum]NHB84915.1 hypothetical protein [Tessaracoccus coleopterorum]
MSQEAARKQEVLDKLTELAELDLYPALQRRSGQFLDLVTSMISADLVELATARARRPSSSR